MLAFIGGFIVFVWALALIVAIITVISNYKLFEKAGVEGWKAIIPGYNLYVTIQIAFSNTRNWLIFAPFLPIIGMFGGDEFSAILSLVVAIIYIYISYSFIRRYAGTGASIASLLIPAIMYPIIAFSDKYEYESFINE